MVEDQKPLPYDLKNPILINDGVIMTGTANQYILYYGDFPDADVKPVLNHAATHIGKSDWWKFAANDTAARRG